MKTIPTAPLLIEKQINAISEGLRATHGVLASSKELQRLAAPLGGIDLTHQSWLKTISEDFRAAHSVLTSSEALQRLVTPLAGADLKHIHGTGVIAAQMAAHQLERMEAIRAASCRLTDGLSSRIASLSLCSANSVAIASLIRERDQHPAATDQQDTSDGSKAEGVSLTVSTAQLQITAHPPRIEILRVPFWEEPAGWEQRPTHNSQLIKDWRTFLELGDERDHTTMAKALSAWVQLKRNNPEARADQELNRLIGCPLLHRLADGRGTSTQPESLKLKEGVKTVRMLANLMGCDETLVRKRAKEAAGQGPLPQRMPKPFDDFAATKEPPSPQGGRGKGWEFQKIDE